MRKPSRKAASKAAPRKTKSPVRKTLRTQAQPDISPTEVEHLEELERRYKHSEQAWLRMTAPPDGEDRWSSVEEHLLDKRQDDSDRRWKFFSK